ncbi:hypothetical protein GGR56DRAFT_678040 [Xylariaceae sp. FL0804]|nr:hypothetical protein GGR56DRAFT_678040 [Xylariaceae sp. FL0804]
MSLTKVFSILAAGAAFAAALEPVAVVRIEASHGGAGNGLTNTTFATPLGSIYADATKLDEVSTLYLDGVWGADATHVTCTPYAYNNGTGRGGLAFTTTEPSYLSTNTVQVGSVICRLDS